MTRVRLAVLCAIGTAMWACFFWVLSLFGINIGLGRLGQILAALVLILILVGATVEAYVTWDADYRARMADRTQRARVERQRRLLAIADRVEEAPPHEQERLYREAQALSNEWDSAA